MSETLLDGRVALVTGGGRGIGAAISRELAAQGARVVIADSGTGIDGEGADPGVAAGLAAEIGDAAEPFAESIASPEAARAAVARAVDKFGGLDIVVNNAAILRDAFIFKGEPGDWDAVIRNNLSAAFYVLAAATPVLRGQAKAGRGTTAASAGVGGAAGASGQAKAGRGTTAASAGVGGAAGASGAIYNWGRIVNIISTAGLYGNYGQASYAAAKAGLVGLTRVTALDMARAGVTANAVAPFAHTRVTDIIQPANEAQAVYKERALKVGAEHVARFVTFLCLPAAQEVSGQIFGVRGREIFLFSQPRPVAVLTDETEDWQPLSIAHALSAFEAQFTPLKTDLEEFNTEPLV